MKFMQINLQKILVNRYRSYKTKFDCKEVN